VGGGGAHTPLPGWPPVGGGGGGGGGTDYQGMSNTKGFLQLSLYVSVLSVSGTVPLDNMNPI